MIHIAPVKICCASFVCHCFLHMYYNRRGTVVQKVKSELFKSSERFWFCVSSDTPVFKIYSSYCHVCLNAQNGEQEQTMLEWINMFSLSFVVFSVNTFGLLCSNWLHSITQWLSSSLTVSKCKTSLLKFDFASHYIYM